MAKRKAPQKTCPECNSKCHARSSTCECGYIFFQKQLSIVDDWKMLGAGDTIKSVKGNGSYWLNPDTKEKKMHIATNFILMTAPSPLIG